MKSKRCRGPDRAQLLSEIDALICWMRALRQNSGGSGVPGRVEIDAAIRRARRLRRIAQNLPETRVNWRNTVENVVWLIEKLKGLYSLLSFELRIKVDHGPFSDYIYPPTGGGNLSARDGAPTRCFQNLLFGNRVGTTTSKSLAAS